MVAYLNGKLVSDSKERISDYKLEFDKQVEIVYKQIIGNN